jgi:hypothetical protein
MHAAVWLSPSATAPLDLGAAKARWSSSATAINDRGLVVGSASDPAVGDIRAAAWRLP